MKPVKITERNIMFTEPMTRDYDLNIGLIRGKKYDFIIDTGLGSGSVRPLIEYIGSDKKPVIVVNTHWHWDHIWGNFIFENYLIIGHPLCRELQDKHWEEAVKENMSRISGGTCKYIVNTTFLGSLYFHEDGIKIFSSPGHSGDDISVYDTVDKVLYAGDNIGDTESGIVPWIDTDQETFQKLIETYNEYDFKHCISGHNKPQTKDVLKRMETALPDAWKRQKLQ